MNKKDAAFAASGEGETAENKNRDNSQINLFQDEGNLTNNKNDNNFALDTFHQLKES